MDFVAAWKASSIILTGAFGILGLLTEFKDKEKKAITKWGYIALAGIVISTAFGTAAQLKESRDNAKAALAVALRSERTLTNIQRSLQPLTGPRVRMKFSIPCNYDESKRKYCEQLYDPRFPGSFTQISQRVKSPPGLPDEYIVFHAEFFPRGLDPGWKTHDTPEGDWSLTGQVSRSGGYSEGFWFDIGKTEIDLRVDFIVPIDEIVSNGRILSVMDLPGSTLVLQAFPNMEGMKPTSFSITFNNGQRIACEASFARFKETWWMCRVPDTYFSATSQSNESSADQGPAPPGRE